MENEMLKRVDLGTLYLFVFSVREIALRFCSENGDAIMVNVEI